MINLKITEETVKRVLKFRDDRNWKQFHTPKDLAISLSLEVAEILELFQWSGTETGCEAKMDKMAEELADVLSYCILLADVCELDIDDILNKKLVKNAEHYPVDKAYGKSDKYTEL